MSEPAIVVEDVAKAYGNVQALAGVSLSVPSGSILGVLGPNGAGKTTLVRICATLLRPDSGSVRVAGFDVVAQADELRRHIGLAGQYAAVDETLTGHENLEAVGRLYHLGTKRARARADELLERFELTDAAKRPAKTYSGGMRRRLDLAAALVASPPILFLDEPTTGLDPRSRRGMWETIEARVAGGSTLLLTTQYLEEADALADRIVVIDHGRIIAEGTADELKTQVGGERVMITVADRARTGDAAGVLADLCADQPTQDADDGTVSAHVSDGPRQLAEIVRRFDTDGIEIADLALAKPTLDDVFLTLTGREAEETPDKEEVTA